MTQTQSDRVKELAALFSTLDERQQEEALLILRALSFAQEAAQAKGASA